MNGNFDNDLSRQLRSALREEIVPRRVVLKSALAAGCGLLLPSLLIGCDSKQSDGATGQSDGATGQSEGTTGAAQSGTPDTGADAPAAPVAPGKVSQASVQYQTQPKGEQQCSRCVHFIPGSNSCKVVEGEISPEAWCALWAQEA